MLKLEIIVLENKRANILRWTLGFLTKVDASHEICGHEYKMRPIGSVAFFFFFALPEASRNSQTEDRTWATAVT